MKTEWKPWRPLVTASRPSETPKPLVWPVVALRDLVVFPNETVPLFLGRPKSLKAVKRATKKSMPLVLLTQRDATVDDPSFDDLFEVGTAAEVLQVLKLPDGTVKMLVRGTQRVRVVGCRQRAPFLEAEVELDEGTWKLDLPVARKQRLLEKGMRR